MQLVIDEDVPPPVRAAFEAHGHTVVLDLKDGLKGTKDEQIAITASQHRVVVVTFNRKHFARLIRKYRDMGLISLNCSHPVAIRRIETEIDAIEFHFDRCQRLGRTFHVELGVSVLRSIEQQDE